MDGGDYQDKGQEEKKNKEYAKREGMTNHEKQRR